MDANAGKGCHMGGQSLGIRPGPNLPTRVLSTILPRKNCLQTSKEYEERKVKSYMPTIDNLPRAPAGNSAGLNIQDLMNSSDRTTGSDEFIRSDHHHPSF